MLWTSRDHRTCPALRGQMYYVPLFRVSLREDPLYIQNDI